MLLLWLIRVFLQENRPCHFINSQTLIREREKRRRPNVMVKRKRLTDISSLSPSSFTDDARVVAARDKAYTRLFMLFRKRSLKPRLNDTYLVIHQIKRK